MGPGGRDAHAVASREADDLAAQIRHVLADLGDVGADARAHLNDRLMHLGLDAFLEKEPPLFEHLLDVRAQLARLRIDDLELLLDADRESRALAHRFRYS